MERDKETSGPIYIPEKPKIELREITSLGVLTLQVTKSLIVPSNYNTTNTKVDFVLKILPDPEQYDAELDFDWEWISFEP